MDKLEYTIERLTSVDENVFTAMQRLTAQLSSNNQATLTTEYLQRVVSSDAVTVLVARLENDARSIIGMQPLIVFALPTNVRAIIENGAVDPDYVRRGVLSSLIREAIALADTQNVNSVRTSTSSSNDASRGLLTKLGFVREEGYDWFEYDIQQGNRF